MSNETVVNGVVTLAAVPLGTDGDDSLAGDEGNNLLQGGAGNDVINGEGGDDTLEGGAGADVLLGGAGNDSLDGGDGDDVLDGGSGADRLSGGAGDDVLIQQEGNATLSGGDGNDALFAGDGADQLSGAAGDDHLFGEAGNDVLDGGTGSDMLSGEAGTDTLYGGAGNDTYAGGTGSDYLLDFAVSDDTYQYELGDGTDYISDRGGADTLQFGAGIAAGATSVISNWGQLMVLLADGGRVTLDSQYDADTGATQANAIEQVVFSDGTVWDQQALQALAGLDRAIWGTAGGDVLAGTDAADRISGGAGDDALSGGAGADILSGGEGGDTLAGGTGNDELWDRSSASGDTYRYDLGDGQDLVYDLGGIDAVQLGASITADAVTVRHQGGSMMLGFADGGRLQVNGQFSAGVAGPSIYQVEAVAFADGTVWDAAQLRALAVTGGSGHDVLYGLAGDDAMTGGAGNDVLLGMAGNDALDGGAGADWLDGGTGNDTYLLALGGGADTVNDHDATAGNADVLSIGAGAAVDQLWFRQVGANLEVSIIGTADKTTVANWYAGSAYQVEQFRAADGSTLLAGQVQALVSAMAAFAPPAAGQTILPPDVHAALAPVIAASWTA